MRLACNDAEMYTLSNNTPVAINLGYDYCSEHEWGIKGINRALGRWAGTSATEDKVWGLDRHIVTTGTNVYLHEIKVNKQKYYYLTTVSNATHLDYYTPRDAESITSHWDENDFCVIFPNREKGAAEFFLKKFHENKIAIGVTTNNNPFGRGGITLTTDDHYNTVDWSEIIEAQKATLAMWDRHRATGIEEKLSEAGKRWYALSPRLDDKGEIQYWLNPMDQENVNYGWFRLNDLEQWAKNEGKIPKMEKGN
jgi:hypothetical protein